MKKQRKGPSINQNTPQAKVLRHSHLNRQILDMIAHECINRPVLSLSTHAWHSDDAAAPVVLRSSSGTECDPVEQPTEHVFFALAKILWQAFLAQQPPDDYIPSEIIFSSQPVRTASTFMFRHYHYYFTVALDMKPHPYLRRQTTLGRFDATLRLLLPNEQSLMVYLRDMASVQPRGSPPHAPRKLSKQPQFEIVRIIHMFPSEDQDASDSNRKEVTPHAAFVILARELRHVQMPVDGTLVFQEHIPRWGLSRDMTTHVPATFNFEVKNMNYMSAMLKGSDRAIRQAQRPS